MPTFTSRPGDANAYPAQFSPAFVGAMAYAQTVTDSLGVVDAASVAAAYSRTYTESEGLVDAISRGFGKVVTDGLSLMDNLSSAWNRVWPFTQKKPSPKSPEFLPYPRGGLFGRRDRQS